MERPQTAKICHVLETDTHQRQQDRPKSRTKRGREMTEFVFKQPIDTTMKRARRSDSASRNKTTATSIGEGNFSASAVLPWREIVESMQGLVLQMDMKHFCGFGRERTPESEESLEYLGVWEFLLDSRGLF
ncbi:hypothetical protein ABW19_dt0208329 [Dactylella cylindrospora]|nr:hypothetical protein ABW19_dt0208329 [Dactylella cylindrospora]